MRYWKLLPALLALALFPAQTAPAPSPLGASGGEGAPDREQPWLVPSPDAMRPARAVLYRPPGEGPFRLAVVVHASTQNVLRRAQMPQPEYRALAAHLVARGFAVLVPERLGHGATGGAYLEDQGGCDEADYARAGRATADQIALALQFLRDQPFIRKDHAVIVGHSAGGWGALALAAEDPQAVSAIVLFAAGRGGHANDVPGKLCAPHTLIGAAREFGQRARVPVTWLVAANDSYFPPEVSRQLADAFRAGGGKVDLTTLPASGSEGHWLVETESGVTLAAAPLDRALKLGEFETMTPYFLIKYLHVLGAIVILGTGMGIAFFMLMAHRSGEPAFIARTAAIVVFADMMFTLTAVILQPVTGGFLIMLAAVPVTDHWLTGSLALYAVAGLFWVPVIFMQIEMRNLARIADATGQALPPRYFVLFRRWFLSGIPGFGSVMVILWLMIAKPEF